MLQALIAYAGRDNLGDPDFENVGVRWLISLDQAGRLVGLVPLAENPVENKSRAKQFARPFTSPNELNQGTKSHFLCDNLERATLLLDAKATQKADARRVQHDYFKALLAEAASACPSEAPRLNAVVKFLNNSDSITELHRQLAAAKAKTSDNTSFAVDGFHLLDSEPLKDFWRERRRKACIGAPRTRRICLATGELVETLDTTEKVKGVPGGLATGTNLISFDKDSFCSYGLEQAQNAALSASAELKVRSALNNLIETSRAQRLVFNDTVHLHWSRLPMELDPIDPIVSGDARLIEKLLTSVHRGHELAGLNANNFYCLSLSGNGARIVVRDWLESTVPKAQQHVAEWFEDLAIVSADGIGIKRDFKFGALLYGMVRAELDELSPQIRTQLFHCALRGHCVPLPQAALAAALRRQYLDPENKLNPARLALIKACLIRSPKRKETDTTTEKLNPESKDRAYLCGQLFAIVGRLQLLALGKIGASLANRTYGRVATRPATTFGPVFMKLPAYLKKANARFTGSGTNKQKELENLRKRIEGLGGIPQILGLEDQGRFALGYYCQLAQYREDRVEAEAAKKAEERADVTN